MKNDMFTHLAFKIAERIALPGMALSLKEEMMLQDSIMSATDNNLLLFIQENYASFDKDIKLLSSIILTLNMIENDPSQIIEYLTSKRKTNQHVLKILLYNYSQLTKYNISELCKLFGKNSFRSNILAMIASLAIGNDAINILHKLVSAEFANLCIKVINNVDISDDELRILSRNDVRVMFLEFVLRKNLSMYIDMIAKNEFSKRAKGNIKSYPYRFVFKFYDELKFISYLDDIGKVKIKDEYAFLKRCLINKLNIDYSIVEIDVDVLKCISQKITPQYIDTISCELAQRKQGLRILHQDNGALSSFVSLHKNEDIEYKQYRWKYRPCQYKFRNDVIRKFHGKCVLCNITHTMLIEAAHLIPKSANGNDSIENGILFCCLHHKAFDDGLFVINPETFSIEVAEGVTHESINIIHKNLAPLSHMLDKTPLIWRWNRWIDNTGC